MLRDLDSFLPLVVRVVGDVLDQSVDQCVLVQGLRADHHVSLAVPVLTGHRVSDLLLVWSDLHVRAWHGFALPEKIGQNLHGHWSMVIQKGRQAEKIQFYYLGATAFFWRGAVAAGEA